MSTLWYTHGILILQSQDLRVDQVKESYIRVNTRELNRELYTRLSTLYTNKGTISRCKS